MEKSLFQFIWKNSKRSQIILLFVTLLTFPLLYVSLELPKRIINDAIGGTGEDIILLGITLTQVEFLMVLCVGFLLAVLANGLLKMRLNTMKGVLAERLLRRFRFQLLTRTLRFPRPFFRSSSQGELVSMVTSEAEPMGGLMGDMLSQPLFQGGQMLTILAFLFGQSFWFGMVSIALIPLQAWIIPKLQRQLSLLNKSRILEVRTLSAEIGETAAGASDIRTNGGVRHRMALFSNRLGILFGIRLKIYEKKYFMKFLNNFINQLTPFFFYSVGGYLAITGEITVGALVAALAAYKDLSSPWKEVLDYYNQLQDMAVRWEVVTEKFTFKTLVDASLFDGTPNTIPKLDGEIQFRGVTVLNEEGYTVLDDINLTIPQGARVAFKTHSETTEMALVDLLTREVLPTRGAVNVAGYAMNELHQAVISNRIGSVNSMPYLFHGTLGENLFMPFMIKPVFANGISEEITLWQEEAAKTGNSTDPFNTDWIVPEIANFKSMDDIREWWFTLVEAMGNDDFMVRSVLNSRLKPESEQDLADAIVQIRPLVAQLIAEAGLDDIVFPFDPAKFNQVVPLGSNLFYAMPTQPQTQELLSRETKFFDILRAHGLIDELAQIAAQVIEELNATFGPDDTSHPLFRRFNMNDQLYNRLNQIVAMRRKVGNDALPPEDFALMLTVPFTLSAEQIGPAFPASLKERILEIRAGNAAQMVAELDGLFETIHPQKNITAISVLENALYGGVSCMAGARTKDVEDVVIKVIEEKGLRRLAAQSILNMVVSQGGENLTSEFRERVSLSRAAVKKPDIMIMRNAFASQEKDIRAKMRDSLAMLMPDTTQIYIQREFVNPSGYDLFFEIENGKLGGEEYSNEPLDDDARRDLDRKLRIVAKTDAFRGLDQKQQRLLAFSGQWYKVKASKSIFKANQKADAAYICVSGLARVYWPKADGMSIPITEVGPGRLIGDLAVIQNENRSLDLVAVEDSVFLRIGAQELLAVIENDAAVATNLLRTVAGHLNATAEALRETHQIAALQGVDLSASKQLGSDTK